MNILSPEYVRDANLELKTRECLNSLCSQVGAGEVEVRYANTENYSLAGVQDKVSVVAYLHYGCTACGVQARLHE